MERNIKTELKTLYRPRAKHLSKTPHIVKLTPRKFEIIRLGIETTQYQTQDMEQANQRNNLSWPPGKLHRAAHRLTKPLESNDKGIGFPFLLSHQCMEESRPCATQII